MPNRFQNGNGYPSQVLPGGVPAILNTDSARSLVDRGSPIASNRPARRTRKGCLARKCAIRSFSVVSGRSSHRMRPRGPVFGASNRPVLRAHARVSCAWKSPSKKISPEISPVRTFKKPCIFKGLREISPISPVSPGCRGCVVSCAQNDIRTPGRSSIECASEGRFWPSLCLWDKAASTDKSTRHEKIHKISTHQRPREPA